MSKPHGIIVFGANGSGKIAIARELADILNFRHMDIEDYAFLPSEIPYSKERTREECIRLMLSDIETYNSFVISAVTGDFGAEIQQMYDIAVFVTAPVEIRVKRISQREYQRHGKRILIGGDMHEQYVKFVDFAANRSLSHIEQWAETLACPVIRVDGAGDCPVPSIAEISSFYGTYARR
ncbi:hypothetical protein FACS189499_03540 [Clostridia bacterium]|nr:hypothetical protein FACS189499_03540 [Clostridia bacterium]